MSLLAAGVVFGVANKRSIAWAIAQTQQKRAPDSPSLIRANALKENVRRIGEHLQLRH